jgi:hypothetical protein
MSGMRSFERHVWLLLVSASLPLACLEPNPYAVDAGSETGSSTGDGDGGDGDGDGDQGEGDGDNGDGDGDDGGLLCDPCDLGFELLDFEAGPDGFIGEVPKPDHQFTAAFALVREYVPGNSDNLGYAIDWEDLGDAWEIDVELFGAANNSRVRGVAVVLGSNDEPTVDTTNVDIDEGCDNSTIDGLDGRALIDVLERYQPGDDEVFSFTRQINSAGNSTTIDYCITDSQSNVPSLRFKLVAFELPEGVTVMDMDDVTLDSNAPGSVSFGGFGNNAQVLHAIGVREFDEAAAPDLGYVIDCDEAAPFGCDFELRNFSGGARAVVGGAIVAIQ